MRIQTDAGPGFWAESEPWTCPKCGGAFTAVLTDEDLEDGCADGVTMCPACVGKLLEGVTAADVVAALKRK